ncbi:DUF4755 domain-containing protein [Massilia sp. PWRC2]|uniref:DUF4755 domain-containing protein n=1 Tax=Massilia sp. PWRC2 TaxID=2804626 RepID=UPI003CF30889
MKPVPKSALITGGIGVVMLLIFHGILSLIGVGLLAWAAWLWFEGAAGAPPVPKEYTDHRGLMAPLKFNYLGKLSGIALDPDNKVLHAYQNKAYRAYPFGEIRKWSANVQSGGGMVGGHGNLGTALAVTAANTRNARANMAATGFFIEVRDIDFPKWKIDFPVKGLEQTHDRWMEIFRQYVNET